MFFAKQVVDSFDRIEGGKGYFDEECDPVGHGTVPKTRQFLRFEDSGTFALFADEASGRVDELAEVEVASFVVFGSADKVDGIEMGGTCKNGFLLGIGTVDLSRFDYLQACDALSVACVEGATTGFSLVFYHAANADWTVEQAV